MFCVTSMPRVRGDPSPTVRLPTPATPGAERPAFTLIELLVVIGIIAILISLLLPTIVTGSGAREFD